MREVAAIHHHIGRVLLRLGSSEQALEYFEKELEYVTGLSERNGDEKSLRALAAGYGNMSYALGKLGRPKEAVDYYEKEKDCRKEA